MSTAGRPAPPPPPSRKGQVKVVRALYKYVAMNEDELSFDEGDTLYIIDSSDPNGWWKAKCNGKAGLIPSNYVTESMEAIDNPLHEAAKRGNVTFLRECLDNGVMVNGLDKAGSTPLYWAAHGGHTECLQVLLSVPSITTDAQNKLGDTALHASSWKGHEDCVRLLLESNANPHIKNAEGKSAYELAKNPGCAALLQRAVRASKVNPVSYDEYIDDEDSD